MEYNNWKYFVIVFLSVLTIVTPTYEGDPCSVDSITGVCVDLKDCKPLMDEIDKAGLPTPSSIHRKLRKRMCGFNKEEPLVCCIESPVSPTPDSAGNKGNDLTLDNRGNNNQSDSNDNKAGDPNDGFKIPPEVTKHPNLRLLPNSCGIVADTDKILHGAPSKLFEFPWMALIAYNTRRGLELGCGATVINENYVLTAAHCVVFLGQKTVQHVVLGEYDTTKDPDCVTTESDGSSITECTHGVVNASIESVTAHQGYSPGTLVDDIALIRLSNPIDLSGDSIKPICLPTTPMLQKENMVGTKAEVAGWGAMDNGLSSTILLHVDLPILDNRDCNNAYKITLRETQLCAGGRDNKDSCSGDSGGPLMSLGTTFYGSRYIQRGIVSYGSKRCGIVGYPGVYTNVAHYMDWILDHMDL